MLRIGKLTVELVLPTMMHVSNCKAAATVTVDSCGHPIHVYRHTAMSMLSDVAELVRTKDGWKVVARRYDAAMDAWDRLAEKAVADPEKAIKATCGMTPDRVQEIWIKLREKEL